MPRASIVVGMFAAIIAALIAAGTPYAGPAYGDPFVQRQICYAHADKSWDPFVQRQICDKRYPIRRTRTF